MTCPICGCTTFTDYFAGTPETWPAWVFACGLQLVNEGDRVTSDNLCAMQKSSRSSV